VEEGSGSSIKVGILEFSSDERHRLLIPPAEVVVGVRETYHQFGVGCPGNVLGVLDVAPQIQRQLQIRRHVRHCKRDLCCRGRGERRPQRLVRTIGIEPVMEQRRRGRLSPFEGLANGPVEPRTPSCRQIVIQSLPQEGMGEHELVGTVPLIDDPGVHRCIRHSVHGPLVESCNHPGDIDREIRADHRRDLKGGHDIFTEMLDATANDLAHSLRNAVVVDRRFRNPSPLCIERSLILEMARDLLDKEWVALRLRGDRLDDLGCRFGPKVTADHLVNFVV